MTAPTACARSARVWKFGTRNRNSCELCCCRCNRPPSHRPQVREPSAHSDPLKHRHKKTSALAAPCSVTRCRPANETGDWFEIPFTVTESKRRRRYTGITTVFPPPTITVADTDPCYPHARTLRAGTVCPSSICAAPIPSGFLGGWVWWRLVGRARTPLCLISLRHMIGRLGQKTLEQIRP